MATSRTGTSTWKKVRAKALRLAQARGQDSCPYCGVTLDYIVSRTPRSAEPDHAYAHAKGGQDHIDNLIVICRRCNQSKGDRPAPKSQTIMAAKPLRTSRQW
ncbi:HNH endonuclease [Zhihengliuella halotolerans]|uniref:HNH endonuclease n=1 Tax=Zhihengliuella halotolerans TaxID=370736 RepID=UPI0015E09F37